MCNEKRTMSGWLLLFLAVTALFLAACGDGAADPEALTIMGKRTDLEKSYMQAIFTRYEQATGKRIEKIEVEDAAFETAAAERFASGEGPDLLMHFNNADLERFDVANDFVYLDGEDWVTDLKEGAKAYCQDREGHLLGLPFWESSVSGCYYNKTILDSLGLRPAATQQEFNALCQALQDAGYTPVCWPADGCTWMPQFGLDPIFADEPALLEQLNAGQITYGEIPQVTQMVQWLSDAAGRGWFGGDYRNTGWDDLSPALGSGQAVMTFIWDTWFYTDFAGDGKYTVDDFALMPVFMGTAAEGTYEGGNLNMMMVNQNGAHREQALEFLRFCATAENYNAAFEGISTVSCFQGQTTNIESQMVLDAAASISEKERVSTAATKIAGYSAEDVSAALNDLFDGKTDVAGCIAKMDDARLREIEGRKSS